MTRPIIGICAAVERARWGAAEAVALLSPRSYSSAVQTAGGLPLLLPPDRVSVEEPGQLLGLLDGLVLAGGSDIDPAIYGAEAAAETGTTNLERDRFERALGGAALDRGLPVLGICRGMQMLNVIEGGTLVQHLGVPGAGGPRHRTGPGLFADHDVSLAAGSLAARLAGAERFGVRSLHHQSLGALGDGVVASGWSDDGLVEAIELPRRRFGLGVLWHPEEDDRDRLFGPFVAEAGRARATATG